RSVGGVSVAAHPLTGARRLEPGDHAQERRLAAPARAEQRRQRPFRDRDRHVRQRREFAEALRHVHDRDAHQCSFGWKTRNRTTVVIAISASTPEAAYAPDVLKSNAYCDCT